MNKKLGRQLNPSMGLYLVLMFAFVAAAALMQYYILAAVELVVAVLVLVLYLLARNRRRKNLQAFTNRMLNEQNAIKGEKTPFPMVVLRLADSGIVYVNDAFIHLTEFQDNMAEKGIEEILPGFSMEWLISGKKEYPYDVTLGKRRYRVYGSQIRADDPNGTWLGVLYFTDLTELYQVRDEYIRSRPVVSIILIDNYFGG